jgi:septal ring factor EnvC (AmiA/AmiB activator)
MLQSLYGIKTDQTIQTQINNISTTLLNLDTIQNIDISSFIHIASEIDKFKTNQYEYTSSFTNINSDLTDLDNAIQANTATINFIKNVTTDLQTQINVISAQLAAILLQ